MAMETPNFASDMTPSADTFDEATVQGHFRDERGGATISGLKWGAAVGAVAFGLAAFTHPFGSHTTIEQSHGVITGYAPLDETIVAGVHVQTSSKSSIVSGDNKITKFIGQHAGLSLEQSVSSQVDALMCQKNAKVSYSFNKRSKVTTVYIPAKALCYEMVVPPEYTKTSSVKAGLGAMPADIVLELAENLGIGSDSNPRDAVATRLTQYNNYSNLDEAYNCMPLAYKNYGRARFVAVNTDAVQAMKDDLEKKGAALDVNKIKIDAPDSIPVPPNKYTKKMRALDAQKAIEVTQRDINAATDCKESDAARLQRDALLKAAS